MKRCTTLYITREMQINIMRLSCTTTRIAKFLKVTIPTQSKNAENSSSGSLLMEYRIVQLLWMTVSDFLILLYIHLACDPSITLLNTYPSDPKTTKCKMYFLYVYIEVSRLKVGPPNCLLFMRFLEGMRMTNIEGRRFSLFILYYFCVVLIFFPFFLFTHEQILFCK